MTQSPRRPPVHSGASRLDALLRLRKLRDVSLILLAIVVGGAALAGMAYMQSVRIATNWGFGPEWRCSWPGKGGPVCVKHPAPVDKPATTGG